MMKLIQREISPKMINIGKRCTQKERVEIKKLLIKYKYVFSWIYEDLKKFMDEKFKDEIPLQLGATPFRQKQRN